jgi:hypothetical protein
LIVNHPPVLEEDPVKVDESITDVSVMEEPAPIVEEPELEELVPVVEEPVPVVEEPVVEEPVPVVEEPPTVIEEVMVEEPIIEKLSPTLQSPIVEESHPTPQSPIVAESPPTPQTTSVTESPPRLNDTEPSLQTTIVEETMSENKKNKKPILEILPEATPIYPPYTSIKNEIPTPKKSKCVIS